ncbi:MAG: sodium/glutamate symporter [Acidobacteria bacterium]|nr:sodium/glutamate symporter [Acidobacteriota bacterium]MCI0625469.1 sodium/glutamate symporter [Acidobacteriota bacterium]
MFKLDLVQTVTFAGVVLFLGYQIRRLIPPLARYNIPAAVIGGMITSLIFLLLRQRGIQPFVFDTTLQTPLMIAFFTTIGFGASLSLLRVGGPQVVLFSLVATVMAVAQNVVGILVALPLGMHPLFGVLSGSVTLTGGPATGLAFAPLFEQAGVAGAATLAVAAAMVGIISGGLIGGPIGTALIERHKLKTPRKNAPHLEVPVAAQLAEEQMKEAPTETPSGEDKESYLLLKSLVIILVAMWIGSGLSRWLASLGVTLPAYIGAMLVAAVSRNLDDATRLLRLSQKLIDDIGTVSLSLFLVLALMTLKLWELAGLALPLLVILAAQVLLIALVCLGPVFRLMGKDYDSAVMSGGFCGFMLGTTANAMANMEALVDRYGPAPRAFLVVPMVGAFFIDFTNALLITLFLNFWR